MNAMARWPVPSPHDPPSFPPRRRRPQEYDSYIDLQRGASLGAEIPISFDAVQAESLETLAGFWRWRPEVLSA